jgi:hypothetical protein
MKLILTVFVVIILLACVGVTASAADVLDLSTLSNKPSIEAVSLPKVSPTMPTMAPTSQPKIEAVSLPRTLPAMPTMASIHLGGSLELNVSDLSTLGKNAQFDAAATMIKGPSPVTVTPMFAVKNGNVTNQAGSVFTLPQAISANAIVYTMPIAIFGGA